MHSNTAKSIRCWCNILFHHNIPAITPWTTPWVPHYPVLVRRVNVIVANSNNNMIHGRCTGSMEGTILIKFKGFRFSINHHSHWRLCHCGHKCFLVLGHVCKTTDGCHGLASFEHVTTAISCLIWIIWPSCEASIIYDIIIGVARPTPFATPIRPVAVHKLLCR